MVGISGRLYSWKKSRFDRLGVRKVSTFCPQMVMGGQQRDTRARTCWIDVFATSSVLGSDLEFKRPSYSLTNSLRNARDSDLMQIEDAFKDSEGRFWEKNSSEGIVGNSEDSRTPLFLTRLIRSPRYFKVIFLSLHFESTPLFRTCHNRVQEETPKRLCKRFVICGGVSEAYRCHPTSDFKNPTSDIRHPTSDI